MQSCSIAFFIQLIPMMWGDDDCRFIGSSDRAGGPVCGTSVFHTCAEATDLVGRCPAECRFLVIDPFFPCSASCVHAGQCGRGDPRATYPNATTHLCEHGNSVGCKRYVGDRCVECRKMFELVDGKCYFNTGGVGWFSSILGYTVLALLAYGLPIVFYRCTQPVANEVALHQGFRHQERCVPMRKKESGRNMPGEPFQFPTNIHKEMVAGPGLNLYYNSVRFWIVSFALCMCVTYGIYQSSDFSQMDIGTGDSCLVRATGEVRSALQILRAYQQSNMVGLALLWLALLGISLLHVYLQSKAFLRLDRNYDTMADFAIGLEGFPDDAGEAEIKEYLDSIAPDTPVCGVSVAYNYFEHLELVDCLLDIHIQEQDVRVGSYPVTAVTQNDQAEAFGANDFEYIQQVLTDLPGSGTAFGVFDVEEHRCAFELLAGEEGEDLPQFRGTDTIRSFEVVSEPNTFIWHEFRHLDCKGGVVNYTREVGRLLLNALILGALVYVPALYYVSTLYAAMGKAANDYSATILGYLIAIINGVMYCKVWNASFRLGYWRKSQADMFNLIGCVVIVAITTVFNFGLSIYTAVAQDGRIPDTMARDDAWADEHSLREASFRLLLAQKVWSMLVPGYLVVPYIVYPLLTYILRWPALLAYWVHIPYGCIYEARDLRTDPKLKPRNAELALEPTVIQIEFDYANAICVTSAAFSLLFFETRRAADVMVVLLVWGVWTYISQMYCHLKCTKQEDFTDSGLDDMASALWGLPVSLVAAASVHWAARLRYVPSWSPFLAFVAALVLYWLLVWLLVCCVAISDDSGEAQYKDVVAMHGYDWFNTNPVLVLKSQYCDGDPRGAEPLVFFQHGKEYLQPGGKCENLRTGDGTYRPVMNSDMDDTTFADRRDIVTRQRTVSSDTVSETMGTNRVSERRLRLV